MPGFLKDTVTGTDRDRLRYYRERFESLKSSRLLSSDVIRNQFQIEWSRDTQELRTSLDCPPREDVMWVASQLRPLVLKKDDTNHLKVCSLLQRSTCHEGLAAWAKLAGMEYQVAMENPVPSGLSLYVDEDLLAPREIFHLFIESEGPHIFASQKRRLEQFGPWRSLLESCFIAIVECLYLGPFELLASTIGICLGSVAPSPEALTPPNQLRVQTTKNWLKEGEFLSKTPLSKLPYQIPHVQLQSSDLPRVPDGAAPL